MGWGAHGIVPKLARHRKRRTPFGEIDEWGGPSISDTVGLEELGLATRPIGYRFKPAIRQHFPRLGWAPVFHRPRFYVGKPGAEKMKRRKRPRDLTGAGSDAGGASYDTVRNLGEHEPTRADTSLLG